MADSDSEEIIDDEDNRFIIYDGTKMFSLSFSLSVPSDTESKDGEPILLMSQNYLIENHGIPLPYNLPYKCLQVLQKLKKNRVSFWMTWSTQHKFLTF